MEEQIEALLEEFYFPVAAAQGAATADIAWQIAEPLIVQLLEAGLLRREDYQEIPFEADTLLVVTKRGLLKANRLA
jgi:hypothetical protein